MRKRVVWLAMSFLFISGLSMTSFADTLSGTFSTTGFTKQYYVVVWVKNQANQFVKTLSVWGNAARNGYWGQMPEWDTQTKKNIVDAVTTATLSGNKTGLKFSWNGTDTSRKMVPNGTYTLQIESVEYNNKISTSTTPIIFDGTTKTLTGTPTAKIINISINVVRKTTSIQPPGAKYAVRPPTFTLKGTMLRIPITGSRRGSAALFGLDGSKICAWNLPAAGAISLSSIKPGFYLLKINSGSEVFTDRILISGR